MTEVSKMTDQQLNRALAELMGYTVKNDNGFALLNPSGKRVSRRKWINEKYAWAEIGYCIDPATSLEVQAAALKAAPYDYSNNLQIIQHGNIRHDMPMYRITDLLTATPRQRAEAAYMTLKE